MTARSRLIMALGGLMLLGACADDGGFAPEGTWQVTVHTRNTATCSSDGVAVEGPALVEVTRHDEDGAVFWQVQDCAAPGQCDLPDPLRYQNPISGGYGGTVYAADFNGTWCTTTATVSGLVLDDAGLTIGTRTSRAVFDDSVACTPDFAALAQQERWLSCVGYELVTAVRAGG